MKNRIVTALLLSLILLFGAYLRITGHNWDDFSHTHPDERFLTALLLPAVGGGNEYTDDDAHFPAQNLLVRAGESAITDSYDLILARDLRMGMIRGSFAEEALTWLSPAIEAVALDDNQAAMAALLNEEIDAALLEARARIDSAGVQVALTLRSRELQSLRCQHFYPESAGSGGYFDARCSPLNPHQSGYGFYVYGHFPLLLAHFGSEILRGASDAGWPLADWQGGHLVWRGLSTLFDLLNVLLIFALGSRLQGRWVGLIAALLYAGAPLAIQKAHYGTTNAIAACLVTLALYFAVAAQQRGKLKSYLLFGLACGAAVASRINLAPLAGVIVVAALIQAAPAFDARLDSRSRRRILVHHILGLALSGFGAFLAFRFLNPYAFIGPGIFDILPNPRWLDNMSASRLGVSGLQDFPPNWQWMSRAAYFYPLKDMFLWAMGPAMAPLAWFGCLWSAWRIVRGRPAGLAHLPLVIWLLVYFVWMNQVWPMTMRYYLPLYSALSLLAGWALRELVIRARGREDDLPMTRVLLLILGGCFSLVGLHQLANSQQDATAYSATFMGLALILAAVLPPLRGKRAWILGGFALGFTSIWGLMFGNVYRHQTTLVQGSRYLFERVPGDFAMRIEGADDSLPLINLAVDGSNYTPEGEDEQLFRYVTLYGDDAPRSAFFTANSSGTITELFAPHLGDPADDADPERLEIRVYPAEGERAIATATLFANLSRDEHPLGRSYRIPFHQALEVEAGEQYRVEVIASSGSGDIIGAGSVVLTEGDWDNRVTGIQTCQLPAGLTLDDRPPSGLAGRSECRGTQAFYKLINSYDQIMSFPVDNSVKAESILRSLDIGDYLTIASNRFYDTQTRNRLRWPLTSRYYQMLFAGELGYELVAVFEETYELGPWRVSDQHLPIYQSPAWLNEIEADEAFHVYDHPAVFIFRKSPDYSSARVKAALSPVSLKQTHELSPADEEAQLLGVIYWTSYQADPVPTGLTFADADYQTQTAGGAWSERFFSDAPANRNQALGVAIWYLTLLILGMAAFPLVYAAFPKLADGGYGVSKLASLLLIGFAAWAGATLKMPLWTQAGLLLLFLLMTLCSALLAYRNRGSLAAFLRDNWRRLAVMELIALLCFLLLIGVRLSNPDLWHPYKGGEKPMDFAYFNGVLRSTIFPPIDPWFAGGFINYYYAGYVLAGVPTLLLGIVPAFAYNLVIPTFFSLTGCGAFCAAYNIAARWRKRDDAEPSARPKRLANPWLAGFLALLMCVVLGNLDTARVLGRGVAALGGYRTPQGLQGFLADEYAMRTGSLPDADAIALIAERAAQSGLADNLRYEADNSLSLLFGIARGLGRLVEGASLPLSHDRWYWGPSRVLSETPGVRGNAITEMPYFTFLYGDLHAHMLNMPLILFTVVFVFHELTQARDDRRRRPERLLSLTLGALAVGMMRAINTWDWPAMTLFAAAGLSYCWWLRWQPGSKAPSLGRSLAVNIAMPAAGLILLALLASQLPPPAIGASPLSPALILDVVRFALLLWIGLAALWLAYRHLLSRASALDLLGGLGAFLLLNLAFALPYTTWHATTYNELRLWQGGKTPLWAYADIHGLFLFLIVSLLLWQTLPWLRATPVAALRGRMRPALALCLALMATVIIAVGLALAHFQVALIVLPLLAWMALLFFRPGQSLPLRYLLSLIGLALAMTLGVEIFVIGGDIGRQNTVFKFYIQVWLLLSVAAGVAASSLIRASRGWRDHLQALWATPGLLLFIIALSYPIVATRARSLDRMAPDTPLTLNGLDYMKRAQHVESAPGSDRIQLLDLSVDHALIRWLQENVAGSPVIMEGRRIPSEYQWNGRFSIATGLPSVLGWNFHQRQQRSIHPLPSWVEQRERNVINFYNTPDIDIAVDIINHFDVKYIMRSGLEEFHTTDEGLAKLDAMLERGLLSIAHAIEGGTIYKVDEEALQAYQVERYR